MPFSRAHFPSPSRRIRAPHTAVCLACLGTPIRSWSFIAIHGTWHDPPPGIGSPKRALPCLESPIRGIRLDFISRARVWPGRGNKTTSAKQARIVVATIAVHNAPTKQACQPVGSDNIRENRLAGTVDGLFCRECWGRTKRVIAESTTDAALHEFHAYPGRLSKTEHADQRRGQPMLSNVV